MHGTLLALLAFQHTTKWHALCCSIVHDNKTTRNSRSKQVHPPRRSGKAPSTFRATRVAGVQQNLDAYLGQGMEGVVDSNVLVELIMLMNRITNYIINKARLPFVPTDQTADELIDAVPSCVWDQFNKATTPRGEIAGLLSASTWLNKNWRHRSEEHTSELQ